MNKEKKEDNSEFNIKFSNYVRRLFLAELGINDSSHEEKKQKKEEGDING